MVKNNDVKLKCKEVFLRDMSGLELKRRARGEDKLFKCTKNGRSKIIQHG